MKSMKNLLIFIVLGTNLSLLRAHREHKVHNIVLYPDKHSWCKTTPIKQVVTWPQCSSQELDNNVCVGACFSYMVPHSEPSAPGDLIRPYCDSCQPLDSVWHTVTLDCKDEDNNAITMQKKVQIITNCSCSSCMETSQIKPDYNTLLRKLAEENMDKNVNIIHETPDLLLDPNLSSSKNTSKDNLQVSDKFMQFFKQMKEKEKVDEEEAKELFAKFKEGVDLGKLHEILKKYEHGEEHQKHHSHNHNHHKVEKSHLEEGEEIPSLLHASLHRGPHHSLVLEPDVKGKIDVEPHDLQPAVAGQEISYQDTVAVDKDKKKDF
ncbi:uncharacterized protein LOC135166390 [Diachasmimorpha longicaudata]|uniref:uncharacterized protein LOC135166390 n=1 Tax=Diachasmimorpha longicaudata TaxID=58733 RepID=UPI0030B893D6